MVEQIADALEDAVEQAAERLLVFSDEEASRAPASGKWSKKQLVGHLIDSAANNHHRFVRAQQVGELVFPKYEQDAWVELQAPEERPWPELVELWRLYNRHLAHVIRRIRPESLSVPCRIGPYNPVPLSFIAQDYLAHLNHHLRQLGVA